MALNSPALLLVLEVKIPMKISIDILKNANIKSLKSLKAWQRLISFVVTSDCNTDNTKYLKIQLNAITTFWFIKF